MAELLTRDEAKTRLEIDFEDKNQEIQDLIDSAEVALRIGTGVKPEVWAISSFQALAKLWVSREVYFGYYGERYTELEKRRQTALMKQLQVSAYFIDAEA